MPPRIKQSSAPPLRRAYVLLRGQFGHQHWWPGEIPFEVCVGAILTQNTAWRNVERAIANLRNAGVLEPHALFALTDSALADLIRPAGFFRVKTQRLRAWLRVLVQAFDGSVARMLAGPTAEVRSRLLVIHGVGPETADCLLLYAAEHLSFVVDAYTRRVFARHDWCATDASYDDLQRLCTESLARVPAARRLDLWRDCHAQLVQVGKEFCRAAQPDCARCPLRTLLPADGPQGVVAEVRADPLHRR